MDREQRRMSRIKRRALVAGATLGASAALAGTAQAATTYTVDTTADDAGNVACVANHCPTLRDALAAVSDGDTIDLSGLSGDIQLTNGALPVAYAIAINGPGAGTLSVTGDASFDDRVFYVDDTAGSAGVSISGLTIEHGYQDGEGGAIMNENNAPLTLTNDVVKDSAANFDGGGIYSNGALNLSGTTVTNNTSHASGFNSGGGGIASDAAMTISGSHIDGNHAPDSGHGGGILVEEGGQLSLSNSTVSGNDAQSGGGGIEAKYGGVSTGDGTTIAENTSTLGGGVLVGRTFGGVVPASRTSGPASDPPVTIDKTTISGNHAELGAGLDVGYTSSGMPITISSSTLSGNHADQGTATKAGGGLEIEGAVNAPIEVIDSTLSGNTADVGGGVGVGNPNGNSSTGPIDTSNGGSLTFDNTTIDSNSASNQDGGGGIYLANYYPNVDQPKTATVALNSTVVAGNSASGSGNDLSQGSGDPSGTPGGFNATYSLIQNPGTAPILEPASHDNILNVDAQLGPLANNGGPTQTMLPANSSPVIDQGKAASGLTSDQRGDPRTVDLGKPKPPGGDGTDIGSVEVQKPPPPPPNNPQISAVVDPATGITMVHATLNGKVNTSGLAVKWHFQWGKTTSYGNVTPDRSISAGHGTVPVSFQISGLKPGTVYHYRVVAVSSAGQTATSSDAQFKTPAPTINVHPGAQYQGKKVRVFGRAGGCPTGDRVTLISRAFSHAHDFAGQPAIYAKVLPGDRYSTVTRIPAHKTPARYAITGRCGGGNFGVTAHLRVLKKKVRAVHVIRFTG